MDTELADSEIFQKGILGPQSNINDARVSGVSDKHTLG